jgi:hypothetical protein
MKYQAMHGPATASGGCMFKQRDHSVQSVHQLEGALLVRAPRGHDQTGVYYLPHLQTSVALYTLVGLRTAAVTPIVHS